jgi:ribose transport system ATP-binding protein
VNGSRTNAISNFGHQTPELVIRGVSKSFGSAKVLHDVDLRIGPGEFVGLMGPNGAGKSTLIKILDGVYRASSGEIRLGDERVDSLGGRADVAFIHQDLGLVEAMSVFENLRLGEQPLRSFGPLLNKRAERRAALEALERVQMEWAVDTPVAALAPGEQALVAIARAFGRGARILFIDEATSTLPGPDAGRVVASLRENAAHGVTIVMVTHKLHEILDSTERVVVLLDGRLAADQQTAGMDRQGLVRLLLQHERAKVAGLVDGTQPSTANEDREPVMEMIQAWGGRAGPIDLAVRPGEVLGLTGLPGSGLHDIALLALGVMQPTSGTVKLAPGVDVALVPPHRETQGGFDELDVHENVTVSALRRWIVGAGLLALGRERRASEDMVERLNVQPGGVSGAFGVLSGGNKQKVIFGRALLKEPGVYVLCEPTRGVDVGTRSEIYRVIEDIRATDAGVLLLSSDAEDLFAACDKVAVVQNGRLSDVRRTDEVKPQDLEAMV